jgi:hypothetical protein
MLYCTEKSLHMGVARSYREVTVFTREPKGDSYSNITRIQLSAAAQQCKYAGPLCSLVLYRFHILKEHSV